MNDDDLQAAAQALSASPDYRVVRRYLRPAHYAPPATDDTTIRTGIYLDTETTGFDPDVCKIIELAMVRFEFSSDGRIYRLLDDYDEFNDPGAPIPPEIVALTGITDEMVKGQRIDPQQVVDFIAEASIIVAHNAAFDRSFVEAHLEGFDKLAWGCSASQVDWRAAGFESRKLEYLAYRQGFFFDGHRAINDCLAGIHLLALPLPGGDGNAFAELLATARGTSMRIYATGSPFETKDLLKQRGYRWNTGDNGQPKAWYVDVDAAGHEAELAWLRESIFHRPVDRLPTHKITPFNRFSHRI